MLNSLNTTPVAIIGMAGIFPQAKNLQEYWDNIFNKIDCITDVPLSRWDPADYYDPNPAAQDKTYCKRGAFIPDIDFDPGEFGLPPNILEVTDVSQLLGLVVARDVLEDAGYGENNPLLRDTTGVILGFGGTNSKLFTPLMARLQYPIWEKALRVSGVSDDDAQKIIAKIKSAYVNWEENSFPGVLGNVVAGRIANRFDLGGTNCVVDAACASSLAALRMAVSELVQGHADMMITGGIDTDNSISTYLCFSKTPAFSKSDYPKPFDAESDGMMAGEGLGMLVIKRLEDAKRDGDRIYAVIRGIGSSSDGRYKSIYAPRPDGQTRALRRAYQMAGFDPLSVGLIEAHGTGTVAGDPAEFSGLKEAFIDPDQMTRGQHIALGSVKSQIAHTKAAAGTASLIKASMALYHKVLPATIHVNQPNPKLGMDQTPFYVNSETRPWIQPADGTPRRAGVSSFGFGGTNFHVVLEEYLAEQEKPYRLHHTAHSLLLSAADPSQLTSAVQKTLDELSSPDAKQVFLNLVNASAELIPPAGDARIGLVADDVESARQLLKIGLDTLQAKPGDDAWENPKGLYYRKTGLETSGKVVATFSGQGSQYVDMGRELAANFPGIRQAFHQMDGLFARDGKKSLSEIVYPPPVYNQPAKDALDKALQSTEHAQPAIGVFSVGLYKLLQSAGFKADFTAGHSFGELTALWAGGVLSDQDYFTLARARGKAMMPPDDPNFDAGAMLAVKGSGEEVKQAIQNFPEITLANWNSNNQVVLAGSKSEIARVQKHLTDKGYSVVTLPVSAAFHTPLVGHAQKPFAAAISSVKFNKPAVPVYSNTTGKPYHTEPKAIQKTLTEHILKPVLFRDEIESIYADGGRIFVEFGPKAVITGLVNSTLGERPHLAVALNPNAKKDSDRQLREAVMQLRVAGLPLRHFDRFEAPLKTPSGKKKSGINVVLNGGLYTSEKTRAYHEKMMNDGFKITSAQTAANPEPQKSPAPAPVESEPARPVFSEPVEIKLPTAVQTESINLAPDLNALEELISKFESHQNNLARTHEQYLANEREYTQAFTQLTQQETELVSTAGTNLPALEKVMTILQTLERSMERFHEHQAETLRVHESYLNNQTEISRTFVNLIQSSRSSPTSPAAAPQVVRTPVRHNGNHAEHTEAALTRPAQSVMINQPEVVKAPPAGSAPPVKAAPVPSPVMTAPAASAPEIKLDAIAKTLLEVVSEKTGYPTEMLEPGMDMEADLGIDSIKRVEILGAMQEHYPALPKIDPEALAELRTLGQVTEHLGKGLASQAPISHPASQTAPAAPVAAETKPYHQENSVTLETIAQALLEVVSEKTGYPTEMLEPGMDMEADLGIDSIKRVEILGAMQERFPQLPKIDPEALAELRTLGQVTEHLGQGLSSLTSQTQTLPVVQPEPQEAAVISISSSPGPKTGISLDEIAKSLLEVVSEKTGYPTEMLEPAMDMEADLGIDSIKRVEILGAMQERYPELPKVDPETLAELRTLGQVTEHLGKGIPEGHPAAVFPSTPEITSVEESKPQNGARSAGPDLLPEIPVTSAWISDSSVQVGIVHLKALPKPDFIDFKLPDGSVCLLTDDGSQTTAELAKTLLERGWQVAVLDFPSALVQSQVELPEPVKRFSMLEASEENLVSVLAQIRSDCGPVSIFIHLSPFLKGLPVDAPGAGITFPESEKTIVKLVFLIAKHLKEDLNQIAAQGRAAFITITHMDGEFGIGQQGIQHPINGGLFGLVKSLNLEWVPVFCRAIDFAPSLEMGQTVQAILAELHDPNRLLSEVGYNSLGRVTLVATAPTY